ncbi:hypothetical protein BTVI_90406 [Pitangus sulphuratus]|nr:hypothetical protein BTVI_90406 [Pitangus sulphuratus]
MLHPKPLLHYLLTEQTQVVPLTRDVIQKDITQTPAHKFQVMLQILQSSSREIVYQFGALSGNSSGPTVLPDHLQLGKCPASNHMVVAVFGFSPSQVQLLRVVSGCGKSLVLLHRDFSSGSSLSFESSALADPGTAAPGKELREKLQALNTAEDEEDGHLKSLDWDHLLLKKEDLFENITMILGCMRSSFFSDYISKESMGSFTLCIRCIYPVDMTFPLFPAPTESLSPLGHLRQWHYPGQATEE